MMQKYKVRVMKVITINLEPITISAHNPDDAVMHAQNLADANVLNEAESMDMRYCISSVPLRTEEKQS